MKNKQKLLYIANTHFPSNSAHTIQIINMCESFNEFSDVSLLSFFKDSYDVLKEKYNIVNDFNIININSKKHLSYYLRELILIKQYLKLKQKFEIIYTRSLFVSSFIKFFTKSKLYYEIHDDDNDNLLKRIIKFPFQILAYNLSDKLIFTNHNLYDLAKKFIVNKKKIIIAQNGVSINKFNKSMDKNIISSKYKLPSNKKLIVYIGGIQKWKGSNLIEESAQKDKNNMNFYIIVGSEKKNITSNLKYINYLSQKEVLEILNIADILIIPNSAKYDCSRKYTSPLKLFEYMASKTPIIASDVESIKKIASENEVLFFRADDSNDLLEKIEKLNSDIELRKKLINNSYNIAKKSSNYLRAKKIIFHT